MDNTKQHWGAWYTAVVVALIIQVAFYYWFTLHWK